MNQFPSDVQLDQENYFKLQKKRHKSNEEKIVVFTINQNLL